MDTLNATPAVTEVMLEFPEYPMKLIVATASSWAGPLRYSGTLAGCALLAAALLACTGGGGDSTSDERVLELEANVQSLEESIEAIADENAALKSELETLRQEQADLIAAQEAADAATEHGEEEVDSEAARNEQPAAAEEGQLRTGERLDGRVQDREEVASRTEGKDEEVSLPDGSALGRTVRLVEESGGEISFVDHAGRGDRSVLVMPREFVDGETPLIVSLHGFRGDSATQSASVPLHERVNSDGFALLLPNGQLGRTGNRFWNPTDQCCDPGKAGEDDVAYLTELVASARELRDFGPVYFFGYSNGGFMSYHMACKGLPGLRAVASLAGTSYVEDSSCDGAPPVSVLHIHGTADRVILFDGDDSDRGDGTPAFYAGAREMVTRWSRRAGCDWPEQPEPYATLDFDRYVPGAETEAFRLEAGCTEGITIELWMGVDSSHSPGYRAAFVDALLRWLLSQE